MLFYFFKSFSCLTAYESSILSEQLRDELSVFKGIIKRDSPQLLSFLAPFSAWLLTKYAEREDDRPTDRSSLILQRSQVKIRYPLCEEGGWGREVARSFKVEVDVLFTNQKINSCCCGGSAETIDGFNERTFRSSFTGFQLVIAQTVVGQSFLGRTLNVRI